MSVALWAERKLRPGAGELIDYDASPHVVQAASTVLGWTPKTHAQRQALFLLVHWGYGSFVGVGREATARLPVRPAAATLAFYLGCQAMAFTLFPPSAERHPLGAGNPACSPPHWQPTASTPSPLPPPWTGCRDPDLCHRDPPCAAGTH